MVTVTAGFHRRNRTIRLATTRGGCDFRGRHPMNTSFFPVLALVLAFSVEASCQEGQVVKTWPFHDLSRLDAALSGLRQRLYIDGVFHSLPKGITLYLDVSEEAEEDGWLMVTVRQQSAEGSGGDPNVSPALVHFYVRESDGAIQWYDVVNDQRRSWAEFLKDREGN